MVLSDPVKELGIINSQKAEKILTFLESCAGAPEGALALIFPFYKKALRILRGSGYVRRCWQPGKEPFWCPSNKPVPDDFKYDSRSALGWLAARLVQGGARLEGREAIFKNGHRMKVYVIPPVPFVEPGLAVLTGNDRVDLPGGWFYVHVENLYQRSLKECLEKS